MAKRWSKKHFIYFLGMVTALVLIYGIAYMNIIKPLKHQEKTLQSEVLMYEKQLAKINDQNSKTEIDVDLAAAANKIPNNKALDQVLLEMQELAKKTNVSIAYIGSGTTDGAAENGADEADDEMISQQKLSMEITAKNVISIDAFLEKMMTGKRFMRIDTMDLNNTANDVTGSLTFTIFYTE